MRSRILSSPNSSQREQQQNEKKHSKKSIETDEPGGMPWRLVNFHDFIVSHHATYHSQR